MAAQLAAKHSINQTMVNDWKRQVKEKLASLFSGRTEAKDALREGELERQPAKIGQLVVERDFLARASGR